MKISTLFSSVILVSTLIVIVGFDVIDNSASSQAFEITLKHDCQQVYRAAVKLMEDEDWESVDLTPTNQYKKINDLSGIEYYYPKFSKNRYAEEFLTVSFKCHIKEYKEENGSKGDNDYHVVLEDNDNPAITMVAEIPDPACPKVKKSHFLKNFKEARKMIDDNTTDERDGVWHKVTAREYTVYGVLYRDKQHGSQESQLPNFVEIHPVLEIK